MHDYEKYKSINNAFFDKQMNTGANKHSVVGWSPASQEKRLNKILNLGDFNGKSILDVGCGIGGFYDFLRTKVKNIQYTGFDINEGMLIKARQLYPEVAGQFKRVDILEQEIDERFDYIVSVGPLNLFLNEETNYSITLKMIDQMFRYCKTGLAFSMTSALSKKKKDDTFYYQPEIIVQHIKSYCNNYRLDHSYLPHDFTLFCYKDDFYGN